MENISVSEKIAYGGGDLASNLILVLTSTFVTFFYTDALGLNAAIIGSIMMFSRLADGFTDTAIVPLSKKFGKRNIGLAGSLISLTGHLMIFLNAESAAWLIVCALVKGVGQAALAGTIFAMVADTIEYGQWKTGKRVEGMLYSSTTFGAKIGAGIGGAAALAILGSAGYDGLAAVQSASALAAIRRIYLVLPIPFLILIPVFYVLYKLDKIYSTVMDDLEKRENRQK